MRDAERREGNQRKSLFLWLLWLCRVEICVEKKDDSSYLPKLFEILLHIFHYRVGRQAAHKYFLCSCDHLEKRERERGQGRRRWATGASNAPRGDFNEASNAASEPAPAAGGKQAGSNTSAQVRPEKRFVLTCYYSKVTSAAAYILGWFFSSFLWGGFVHFFHNGITNWTSNQNRLSTN